jgi:hypothetical protein
MEDAMKSDVLRPMGLALIVALALVGVLNQHAVAATSCTYNQSSGTGATLFATCETVNGNVVKFTSPATIQSIGGAIEGYGVCDYTNQLRYFDWGGGKLRWKGHRLCRLEDSDVNLKFSAQNISHNCGRRADPYADFYADQL